ncbi:DEAD/DEAH box helicase [Streptomonospora sp. S1-112]|uniref:RNA helicase n=1 Tax=Streptomonospora mangrovi TaxID=2883123 RepID=A0A9X3SFI7_9ACTN|nr:DEAD/DEAH box helicase [Streptomonospora mangrovi]MDA0562994.1 DEAD/DEAH box helicase [Streptomonospora mangrovi]
MALPLALAGSDIIGQARTGTGKTFAFGLPLLQRVQASPADPKRPRALVVVPTRELAIQVAADLTTAGKRTGARILTVYGGRAYEPQIEGLRNGIDIVVGTPGRLLDLEKQKHLNLGDVQAVVLDEADKMLDLGFLPDITRILTKTPEQRQTMLFSATMPSEIVQLSRSYLRRPTHVRAGDDDEPGQTRVNDIVQHVFRTHQMDKPEMLARLLQAEGRGLSMVFCQTKRACDKVAAELQDRGFAAAAVHGDLGQSQRERALRAFRSGKIDVLVATDVAARGLDVDDVTHVVNYECPEDEKTYTHRIGRTGRAGRSGTAVTFIDWREIARWKLINTALDLPHSDPPETYSTSEHFFEALSIPAGTKGRLAVERRERAGLEAEEIEDIGDTGPHRGGDRGGDRREQRGQGGRGGRSRNRRRRSGGREQGAPAAAEPAAATESGGAGAGDDSAPAASSSRRRRRRRTRGGVDLPQSSQD